MKNRTRKNKRQTRVKGGADKTIQIIGEVSAIDPKLVIHKVFIHDSGGIADSLNKIDEYIAGMGLSRTLNRDVVNARRKPVHTLIIRDTVVPQTPSTSMFDTMRNSAKYATDRVGTGMTSAKTKVGEGMTLAKTKVGEGMTSARDGARTIKNKVGKKVSEGMTSAKTKVGEGMTSAKTNLSTGMTSAKTNLSTGAKYTIKKGDDLMTSVTKTIRNRTKRKRQ